LTGEFEKQIKKLKLGHEVEKELIDMIDRAISEDPCMSCQSNEACENFKWHKNGLTTIIVTATPNSFLTAQH
jgi:hypothetical protein